MKLNKQHLAVLSSANKDNSRPILTTVKVSQSNGEVIAVATNSYILTEVRTKTEDTSTVEPVLLPPATVKLAQDLLKAHKLEREVEVTENTIAVNGTTNTFSPMEGNYPDYQSIIPSNDGEDIRTLRINPKLLKQVLETYKDNSSIDIEIRGDLAPMVIRSNDYGVEKLSLIMPLRK